MTGSSDGTLPTCPNGHPAGFAGQRFCEVCRAPIGAAAEVVAPESPAVVPVAPPPPPPAAALVSPPAGMPAAPPPPPPPAFEPDVPVAPLPGASVAAGRFGRGGGRSQLPLLLGLAVCLAVAAGAVFVVAKPFGGGSAASAASVAPGSGVALTSPSAVPTDTGSVPTSPDVTPGPTSTEGPTAPPTATPTPAPTPAPVAAKWVAAGSLHAARGSTRLLVLSDGRALVVGDDNFCDPGPAYDSSMAAEVWKAGTWAVTGSLNSARNDLTAQSLAGGKAFVVGGTNVDGISFSSPKIWDPATGVWTSSGLMATARSFPASALLKDGRVIVIGGEYQKGTTDTYLATAEVFTPAAGTFAKTGSLKVARSAALAVTLTDGRVLVAGGFTSKGAVADTEIWNPGTGTWASVGATPIWGGSSLVALSDGGALLAGGQDKAQKGIATVYRFDATADKWVAAAKMITAAYDRVAAVLANGQVLVAGGLPAHLKPAIAAAELFDPATGKWTATVAMPSAREQSKAVLLPDGSILVAGGDAGYFPPASAPWCPKEIADTLRYVPAP